MSFWQCFSTGGGPEIWLDPKGHLDDFFFSPPGALGVVAPREWPQNNTKPSVNGWESARWTDNFCPGNGISSPTHTHTFGREPLQMSRGRDRCARALALKEGPKLQVPFLGWKGTSFFLGGENAIRATCIRAPTMMVGGLSVED